MNKTLKVMTSAALLAGVVAPVAVTTVDAANSKVVVYKVPTVADDFKSELATGNTAFTSGDAISVIQIKKDDLDIAANSRFRLELPEGVKWVKEAYEDATQKYTDSSDATYDYNVNVVSVTDKVLELETSAELNSSTVADIPLFVKLDGATGDLKVTLNALDSTLNSGSYTFAVAESGSVSVSVDEVKTIGENGKIAAIRIDENSVKALGKDAQNIKLRLPNKFKWALDTAGSDATAVDVVGMGTIVSGDGTTEGTYKFGLDNDSRDLVLQLNPGERTTRGTIYIKNLEITSSSDAPFGDVIADVTGTEVDSTSVTVAKYADYGTTVTVDGDAKEIVAGVLGDTSKADAIKAAKIKIKEDIAGSIIENREIKIKFPKWVKVRDIETKDLTGSESISTPVINSDRNEITFTKSAGSAKLDFGIQLWLTVEADKSGDIVAEVTNRNAGLENAELVIAKAVAPVAVTTSATDVVVGVTKQSVGEITIVESKKEAIKEGQFTITLPDNIKFSGTPKVEVTDGNIDLGDVEVVSFDGDSNRQLVVEVDSESTKPSTIKITGAELTLDRTVPVGSIVAKLGGNVVGNFTTNDTLAGENIKFEDTDYTTEFVVANVVTPAPGQSVVKEVQFTIGATSYTVAGEEKTMDVAPFVEAGRTYMPIRYVAEAVGVTSDSIFWDQATQTATLIKGDRVVQLTAGSKALKVNGASITMDAAAKVKDGRTVLPIRFVGQALGASVNYNEAEKSVTIN